ncbi:MAG: MerR family transcriptional regulator [Dehalococcoidia bacterium]|nr:MerR family transcriptional regulator [Dehalococcoidia bacterium]
MKELTIGRAARQTGLTPKTIRFYEDEGLLPAARRSESGYRLYTEADLTRLRLIQRLRLIDLSLPDVRTLVQHAYTADCATFGEQLLSTISSQQAEVARKLTELQALKDDLDALQAHITHCCEGCTPADMAGCCGFCGLTLEEGGETNEIS